MVKRVASVISVLVIALVALMGTPTTAAVGYAAAKTKTHLLCLNGDGSE